jgi:Serine/Threonine/Tyrosine Kinase found in polyvalent proteins
MFIDDDTRKRLKNIVKGIILEGKEDNCTAVRNLLCASFRTSTTVKKDFEGQSRFKKEQSEFLKHHSSLRNWWIDDLPDESSFLTRGGEAQIYLASDHRSVIKVNNAVYYATWLEFFNSLCKLPLIPAHCELEFSKSYQKSKDKD